MIVSLSTVYIVCAQPSDEFVGSQSDTTPPRSAQAQITQDSSPKLPHSKQYIFIHNPSSVESSV